MWAGGRGGGGGGEREGELFYGRGGAGGVLLVCSSSVLDVPLIIQYQFQQSKVYVDGAPIQFMDDFWTFLLCRRDVPTVLTVQKTVEILLVPFGDEL